jgi:peptide/nickel transport system ATP-binding protein
VPRADRKLERFQSVDYIEGGAAATPKIDIQSHWLGEALQGAAGDGQALRVEDLSLSFVLQRALLKKNRKLLKAVDEVGFEIAEGETFGLVGESGSGKSTVARIIAGLHKQDAGQIALLGTQLNGGHSPEEREVSKRLQMIFQDPYSSLNSRMRVLDIVAEPIRFYKTTSNETETRRIVQDLLDHVGLGAEAALKYPHEFSGGQRQRISIARALAARPRVLICDEPTSALDVSIQAQILNLLKDLQQELRLTMLFISHDLPVIRQMCDRVAVMRYGKLVEVAETEALFENPQHPYSKELISLMPRMDLLN